VSSATVVTNDQTSRIGQVLRGIWIQVLNDRFLQRVTCISTGIAPFGNEALMAFSRRLPVGARRLSDLFLSHHNPDTGNTFEIRLGHVNLFSKA